MPHLAEAVIATLSKGFPELCLVSLYGRAYDTSDLVDRHPGGALLMQEHHGVRFPGSSNPSRFRPPNVSRQCIVGSGTHPQFSTRTRNIPAMHTSDLMRESMLRFDSIAHVGRFGAPRYARQALPRTWNLAREVVDALGELVQQVSTTIRPRVAILGQFDMQGVLGDHAATKPSRSMVAFNLTMLLAACVSVCAVVPRSAVPLMP
eukprot:3691487-Prymnesium_polylepis.1